MFRQFSLKRWCFLNLDELWGLSTLIDFSQNEDRPLHLLCRLQDEQPHAILVPLSGEQI